MSCQDSQDIKFQHTKEHNTMDLSTAGEHIKLDISHLSKDMELSLNLSYSPQEDLPLSKALEEQEREQECALVKERQLAKQGHWRVCDYLRHGVVGLSKALEGLSHALVYGSEDEATLEGFIRELRLSVNRLQQTFHVYSKYK